MIGALYAVETQIRDGMLTGDAKRAYRTQHAAPVVARFFAWVEAQFAEQGWLPSSPLTVALAYAREREAGLTADRRSSRTAASWMRNPMELGRSSGNFGASRRTVMGRYMPDRTPGSSP